MSENYITISSLNDFVFCPYSIYLHNVYMEAEDETYKAAPQIKGTLAHESIDKKTYSSSKDVLLSLTVVSNELGVMGKIDTYKGKEKALVERKYQLKQIFRGQLYQLWAQYYCLLEMGYEVDSISFYEISTNKTIPIELPTDTEKKELLGFIETFKAYDPSGELTINENKCKHCIYCNLCDKFDSNNVYT